MPGVQDEIVDTPAGPTRLRVAGGGGTRLPLVVIHGGPGLTWDYLEEFDALSAQGFPVIQYDQLGSGGSSATPAAQVTLARLLDQLDAVLARTVTGPYAVLTHSSGSVIGLEHALRRPAGLARLVLANGFAASRHIAASIARLGRALPSDQAAAIAASDFGNPAYAAGVATFYGRHVFRTAPSPGLQRSLSAITESPAVNQRLWGRDIFHLSGLYADWDVVQRLAEIAVPTLAYCGEHDEAGFECMDPITASLPGVEAVVMPGTSHVPHMEQPEATLRLVGDFLARA